LLGNTSSNTATTQAYNVGASAGNELTAKGYDVDTLNYYIGVGYTLAGAENNMEAVIVSAPISTMTAYGTANTSVTVSGETIYIVVVYTIR